MKLNHPLPPLKLLLRKEYLYDQKSHHGEYIECVLISVKSLAGRALSFQVLCNNGVLRDKLPISALVTKPCDPLPLDYLEAWDNSSNNITVTKMPFLDMQVSYLRRDFTWHSGSYLFTVDFYETELPTGWSEEASEHKCKHVVSLDSGHLVAQPNNRLRFQEPSFITADYQDKPDYETASSFPKVECAQRWEPQTKPSVDLGELLVTAIIDENYDIVPRLLADGANPNARGGVPLALAVENKNDVIVKLLVDSGASWDAAEMCIDKTDGKLVSIFTRYRTRYSTIG